MTTKLSHTCEPSPEGYPSLRVGFAIEVREDNRVVMVFAGGEFPFPEYFNSLQAAKEFAESVLRKLMSYDGP